MKNIAALILITPSVLLLLIMVVSGIMDMIEEPKRLIPFAGAAGIMFLAFVGVALLGDDKN